MWKFLLTVYNCIQPEITQRLICVDMTSFQPQGNYVLNGQF